MKKTKVVWDWIFNPAFFSAQMFVVMTVGGVLAAYFMRPWLEAGPVRVGTYLLLGFASLVLARRYIKMVRRNPDGMATLLVVASCWVWSAFSATGFAVVYLIVAESWGLWPNWGESLTERIIYFFITGTSIGVAYKAFTFESIPDEALIGRRVSAWPFTLFRRHERIDGWGDDSQKRADEQDARDVRQNNREAAQDARGIRQDERSWRQTDRGSRQDDRGSRQDKSGQGKGGEDK